MPLPTAFPKRVRLVRTAAPGAVLLALTACGGPDTTIGEPAPAGKVAIPARPNVAPAQWPDACALLGDGEIKAVLPDLRNVKRLPGQAVGPGAAIAPKGSCYYNVEMPPSTDIGIGWISFRLEISAAGSPADVAKRFAKQQAAHPKEEQAAPADAARYGADACYQYTPEPEARDFDDYGLRTVHCRRNGLAFFLKPGDFHDVSLNGVVSFKENGKGNPEFTPVVRDRLIPALMRTVAAKV